jgi:hypothetical protein
LAIELPRGLFAYLGDGHLRQEYYSGAIELGIPSFLHLTKLACHSPYKPADGTEFSPDVDLVDAVDLRSMSAFQRSGKRQWVDQIDRKKAENNNSTSMLAFPVHVFLQPRNE